MNFEELKKELAKIRDVSPILSKYKPASRKLEDQEVLVNRFDIQNALEDLIGNGQCYDAFGYDRESLSKQILSKIVEHRYR